MDQRHIRKCLNDKLHRKLCVYHIQDRTHELHSIHLKSHKIESHISLSVFLSLSWLLLYLAWENTKFFFFSKMKTYQQQTNIRADQWVVLLKFGIHKCPYHVSEHFVFSESILPYEANALPQIVGQTYMCTGPQLTNECLCDEPK